MSVNIATMFGEEIEKAWRNHVSPECVTQLRLIVEQMMSMERAMNSQQRIIEKLLQFAVVEGRALQMIKEHQKQFDREFNTSPFNSEKIDDDK